MAFKLTQDHVRKIFDGSEEGNLSNLLPAVEPNVHWRIGAHDDPEGGIGIYVRGLRLIGDTS